MGDELTPKQAEFVRQYLIDLNAKQAAIRTGYSEKNAEMQGSRLMSYAKVQQAVAEGQKQKAAKSARTALDVLEDIQACTREAREGGDLKTALKGLEMEGKHIGMFKLGTVDEDAPLSVKVVIVKDTGSGLPT